MREGKLMPSDEGQILDQFVVDDDICVAKYRLLMLALDSLEVSKGDRRFLHYLYGKMALGFEGDMYFYTARA